LSHLTEFRPRECRERDRGGGVSQRVTVACRAGSVIARIAAYRSWSRAVTRSCCRGCSSHEATMNCSRIRPGSALSCHVRQALESFDVTDDADDGRSA